MKSIIAMMVFLMVACPIFAEGGFLLGDKKTTVVFTELEMTMPVRYHDSLNAFARIGYNQKIDTDKSIKYFAGIMAVSGREFESPYTCVSPVIGLTYYQELK
jgi:hypothetical protein